MVGENQQEAGQPAAWLVPPRVKRRLPQTILAHAEVEAVLALPDLSDLLGLRDRTIMELLYSTGIRRSELCRLRTGDIDPARSLLTVPEGKSGRDRIITISERALEWVDRYLTGARPRRAIDHPDLHARLPAKPQSRPRRHAPSRQQHAATPTPGCRRRLQRRHRRRWRPVVTADDHERGLLS
ncbi:tyrosine-type recombinase/integrase [Conexibacter sp. S30A1]|uniref:tyrosine-type recombinase/integrase n=1 Tax=Conexibacter sp. S30A1 TaxID=2937800 RepID=UPI0035313FB6